VTMAPDRLPPADRRSVFVNAPMGVALCSPSGVLLDVNAALGALLDLPVDDLVGGSLFDVVHPDDAATCREIWASLQRQRTRVARHECRFLTTAGIPVPVQVSTSWVDATPDGGPEHLVLIIEDITDRKALEAQLVHRSLHDALTGLPNRILFQDRLRHALERGQREQTPTCVLVIDLDGFKAINDAYGHPMGDLVLVSFADRLRSVLRASDTAARLGGDEFSIVCENTDRADADVLAERLRGSVQSPLTLAGATMALGMSIGIGEAAGDSDPQDDLERVVREADDAMYADKASRRRSLN
jgi:diguanylate cyclase (GGDEF)-like protein/PAS domain S-box-containing protein